MTDVTMMQLLRDLTPLDRIMCSPDYDRTLAYLADVLPFRLHQFAASEGDLNGWVVPPRWSVAEATIRKDGRLVYDGTQHPLGVIALSAPFDGRVSLEELRDHLHYDHRYPDSLTYHFRQLFRSWARDWGFCVPRELYDRLEPGEYDVRIETREGPGVLKVLDCTHAGALPQVIALCANLDHPGVANDGLAGVAVGVEVMRRLRGRRTRFSYRLVLAPGIIGSEYYLGRLPAAERASILECLCLWMLGSRTELALQASRGARSAIEESLERVLTERGTAHRRGDFETIMINDEYLWEAYDIPTCSLSRFPYPEYHSSRDDVSIMADDRLEEAADIVLGAIDDLERTPLVEKRFDGTPCLSNPRYGLYVDPGQVAFGQRVSDEARRLRLLQDYLPSMRRPSTVRSLARRFQLGEDVVIAFLRQWEAKGLLAIR